MSGKDRVGKDSYIEKNALKRLRRLIKIMFASTKNKLGAKDTLHEIVSHYLEQIQLEIERFFNKMEEWKEPIIEERTVRKCKNVKTIIEEKEEREWGKPEKWEKILEEDKTTIVQGPMGVGKTVLSYQVLKRLTEKEVKDNKKREKDAIRTLPVRIEGKRLNIPQEQLEYYSLLDLISAQIIEKCKKMLKIKSLEEKERYKRTKGEARKESKQLQVLFNH